MSTRIFEDILNQKDEGDKWIGSLIVPLLPVGYYFCIFDEALRERNIRQDNFTFKHRYLVTIAGNHMKLKAVRLGLHHINLCEVLRVKYKVVLKNYCPLKRRKPQVAEHSDTSILIGSA
ncbi:hypothetical protein K501DRAFT_270905 [Backusella circina FSU 941]|nr:hypothetical protein K501DRAFT_270905 [Backusella circina FSU 941]